MRILVLNYEYPPLGGGGGVAAANLAAEWVRQGHSVDYVTTHFRGMARHEVIDGVQLWREPVFDRRDLHTATIVSMLTYPPVAIRRGLQLARAHRYDIINTHFAIPSGPAGDSLARRLGLPNVLSVWGGDIYDPSKRYSPHRHPLLHRVVRRMLNRATCIVPESRDLETRMHELYGTPTPSVRIPIGFVPPHFAPATRAELGLHADRLYAVAVSRLIPRKAHGDLLRAFAHAACAGLELLIVGDGPEESRLRALTAELDLQSRVHFLGRLDDLHKYQTLAASDFFVLASSHEGFGIVFQEAMHCGLPIATTNVGGQCDFLTERQNALLTSPGDWQALAASIRRLATEPALRESLRRNNQREIAMHDITQIAQCYLQLFTQLTAPKAAA